MKSTKKRILLIISAGAVGLVLVLLLAALLVINRVVLPEKIDFIAARIEVRTGAKLRTGKTGYAPFRGIRVQDITLEYALSNPSLVAAISVDSVEAKIDPFELPGKSGSGPVVDALIIDGLSLELSRGTVEPLDRSRRANGVAGSLSSRPVCRSGTGCDRLREEILDDTAERQHFPVLSGRSRSHIRYSQLERRGGDTLPSS